MLAIPWKHTMYASFKLLRQKVSEEEYWEVRQDYAETDPERWERYLAYEKKMEEEERAKSED